MSDRGREDDDTHNERLRRSAGRETYATGTTTAASAKRLKEVSTPRRS